MIVPAYVRRSAISKCKMFNCWTAQQWAESADHHVNLVFKLASDTFRNMMSLIAVVCPQKDGRPRAEPLAEFAAAHSHLSVLQLVSCCWNNSWPNKWVRDACSSSPFDVYLIEVPLGELVAKLGFGDAHLMNIIWRFPDLKNIRLSLKVQTENVRNLIREYFQLIYKPNEWPLLLALLCNT